MVLEKLILRCLLDIQELVSKTGLNINRLPETFQAEVSVDS